MKSQKQEKWAERVQKYKVEKKHYYETVAKEDVPQDQENIKEFFDRRHQSE